MNKFYIIKILIYSFFCLILSFNNILANAINKGKIFIDKDNDITCNSSFECRSSCCYNNLCKKRENCEFIVRTAYVTSGILGLFVLTFGIVYLIYEIKRTRYNVLKIKESIELKNIEDKNNIQKIINKK